MLRHVIAPARFFSQVPNDIIRHPRLSSDAVRLLIWQLSLPADVHVPLSRTAERAGVKKTAFQRAKRQLRDEGYLHEWRTQTRSGRWKTTQLVSNVPLTGDEAQAVRNGHESSSVPGSRSCAASRNSPSAAQPTAGGPTRRRDGRQPREDSGEKTTDHPPAALAAAEALLLTLGRTGSALSISARTARSWAPLAVPWLALGRTHDQLRAILTHGLASARSPLGALRWRLEHALPAPPPPAPAAPEPRLARMRECDGEHLQPRLFLPESDGERRCTDCRSRSSRTAPASPDTPEPAGLRAFRAARTALRPLALA